MAIVRPQTPDPKEQLANSMGYIRERFGASEYLPAHVEVAGSDIRTRIESVEGLAALLLMLVAGLDDTDPQERRTPERFVQALRDMTTPEPFEFTVFDLEEGELDEMIVERNIAFSSLCRHHVLPFTGVAHIAYIPKLKMAGISKLARTVRFHSAGLRTQEQLTVQIGRYLESKLEPLGVAVVMEAEHTCMTLRGARSPGTLTSTGYMGGVFGDHKRTAKAEFLSRINHG